MQVDDERQRAVAHEDDEDAVRLEMEDLVLEVALEIEALLRRDDQEHEPEQEKRRAEEDEPVDLRPVATPEVKEDRQREEDERDGEIELQVVAVIVEGLPEPREIIGQADGGVELRVLGHHADRLAEGRLDQGGQALGILLAADFIIKAAALRRIAPVHRRMRRGGEALVGIGHESDPTHGEHADDEPAIQARGV